MATVALTICENRHIQLPHAALHGLSVGQRLNEDGVNPDTLELQSPGQGFLPPVDESVGARQHENVLALVPGVACRLDAGVGLTPRDDCLALSVATSCSKSV